MTAWLSPRSAGLPGGAQGELGEGSFWQLVLLSPQQDAPKPVSHSPGVTGAPRVRSHGHRFTSSSGVLAQGFSGTHHGCVERTWG